MKKKPILAILGSALLIPTLPGFGKAADADAKIPAVYPVVYENGNYYYHNVLDNEKYPKEAPSERYAPESLIGNPTGSKTGIDFAFPEIASSFSVENGRLYMGLIPFGDGIYPYPVFDNAYAPIATSVDGKVPTASFALTKFVNDPKDPSNNFDLTRWEEAGNGTVGYRVVNGTGVILYDGKIGFMTNKKGDASSGFIVNKASIITGPFVHYKKDGTYFDGIRVSFDTLDPTTATVTVYDSEGNEIGSFESGDSAAKHEVAITGLEPNTEYGYSITTTSKDGHSYFERRYDSLTEPFLYTFRTAPAPGSRLPFAFGFTSDGRTASRGGGMGERFMGGAINGYLLKKIAALGEQKGVSFFQFTGDLISGYDTSTPEHVAELLVWRNTIQPFAGHTPWMVGMGNHEASLSDSFKGPIDIQVDKFPFETRSAETVFSRQFVNPENGPPSEDGQYFDLSSTKDFPDYQETAFHYAYDNVAVISMNGDYWYSPNLDVTQYPYYVGGLHGYIMDGQLQWLRETLAAYEADDAIDHVFVTIHTPAFPNSGHIEDDMWYDGDNRQRPVVLDKDGKNVIEKGIIERRDEFLLAMMETDKVRMLLAGDEHNFCYTIIDGETEIYPDGWKGEDIRNHPDFRPLIEMTNGAAGAPYYGQGEVPWTPKVPFFTARNALSLFYIDGDQIDIEVINPDTLEVMIEVGEIDIN